MFLLLHWEVIKNIVFIMAPFATRKEKYTFKKKLQRVAPDRDFLAKRTRKRTSPKYNLRAITKLLRYICRTFRHGRLAPSELKLFTDRSLKKNLKKNTPRSKAIQKWLYLSLCRFVEDFFVRLCWILKRCTSLKLITTPTRDFMVMSELRFTLSVVAISFCQWGWSR